MIKITEEMGKIIIEKYINGESSTKIAKELNIHFSTVLDYLRKNNIPIRIISGSKKRMYTLE